MSVFSDPAHQLKTWAQKGRTLVTTTFLCYLISMCGMKLEGHIILSPLHFGIIIAGKISLGTSLCRRRLPKLWVYSKIPIDMVLGNFLVIYAERLNVQGAIDWFPRIVIGLSMLIRILISVYPGPRLTRITNWYALSSTVFGESYNWPCVLMS